MPTGKKPVPKITRDERRREIEAIYATASNATKHFINKEEPWSRRFHWTARKFADSHD